MNGGKLWSRSINEQKNKRVGSHGVRNLKLKINQDCYDNLFICGVGYKEWLFISFQLCDGTT